MDQKQKVAWVETVVANYRAMSEAGDQLHELFGAAADCRALNPSWRMFDSYVKAVAQLIGDRDEWLSWFIFENGCGEKALEARRASGRACKIDSAAKLVALLE